MRLKTEMYQQVLAKKKGCFDTLSGFLENISGCPIGSLYFEQWLLEEFSQENLYCLKEIYHFEELQGKEKVEHINYIYLNYLKENAENEVNIKGKSLRLFLKDRDDLMKGVDINVDQIFERVKEDLLENLFEPFQRFLIGNTSYEFMSICGDQTLLDDVVNSVVEHKKHIIMNVAIKFKLVCSNPVQLSKNLIKIMKKLLEESILEVSKQKDMETFQSKSSEFFKEKKKIFGVKNCIFKMDDMEDEFVSKFSDEVLQHARKSDSYHLFLQSIFELQGVDLSKMSRDEKLAFFINIYNVLSLHILIERNNLSNTLIETKLNSKTFGYQIGTFFFTLDMIKRGILLGNIQDWVLKRDIRDPEQKKHVLNPSPWKSISCLITLTLKSPQLKIYHEKDIDGQISEQFKDYIAKHTSINGKKLNLPQNFKDLKYKSKEMISLMNFFIKEEYSSILYDSTDKRENIFEFIF